ncbi:response regulator transcription factor [Methylocapsa acidiphila]|uniref:response regulator transcription factor n=1 Tax=Methylocapsa acidiphila TaxID=133552 RepID=UPI00041255DF|nr:response regulator transcription factor [Methylocapsa acidiphila]
MAESEMGSSAFAHESLLITQADAPKGLDEAVALVADARRSPPIPARAADAGLRTLVVIEERALIRECLVRCLKGSSSYDLVRSFSSAEDWLKEQPFAAPGPVIVLCLGERSEVEVGRDVAMLLRAVSDLAIVVVSDREDPRSIFQALDKGARGYVTTSMAFDVVLHAIHLVRAGGTFVPAGALIASRGSIEHPSLRDEKPRRGLFTARQMAVVELLRQGKANKVIAHELSMCESTVKVHVRNIMKKLRAKNRTEVVFLMGGVEAEGRTMPDDRIAALRSFP